MATKLYPPLIEETLPAFYKTNSIVKIVIPYGMNKATGYGLISGFALRLKTIQGGNIIINDKISTSYDSSVNEVTFKLNQELINEGQFYKAQLAYVDKSKTIGYYSTIGIIKCVAKPLVEIEGFSNGSINLFNNTFIGKYTQNSSYGDVSEKVYSYNFKIYDKNHNLFASSGEQIHDTSQDEAANYSIDKFICNKTLKLYETYYLQYSVTTLNKLKINSPMYHMIFNETLNIPNNITIQATNIFDEGYILINFINLEDDANYDGMYLLSRSSDEGLTWDEISRFQIKDNNLNQQVIKDYFIEQGKNYLYSLQEYNKYDIYTNRIYSNFVYADYEDMFLLDKDRVLRIRYNPKVNSFKNDIPEQKVETIGSKYPFIFRNGNVYYKEFPVAGLISFQIDSILSFLNEEEQIESGILMPQLHRKSSGTLSDFQKEMIKNHLDSDEKAIKISTDLTSDNFYTERYFKLKVLEWLNNGKPKLFKSASEGVYIVRLVNVSLTPENKIGRMIHNFNSIAYEVAELNFKNLLDLDFIDASFLESLTQSYENTIALIDYFNFGNEPVSIKSLFNGTIQNVSFSDFCPGDIITIYYDDSTEGESFIIGPSGEFSLPPQDRAISDIEITVADGYSQYNSNKRIISYTYIDTVNTYFDNYAGIKITSLPSLALPYHDQTIYYESPKEDGELAEFDLSMLGNTPNELINYFGYSLYLDAEHTKPKFLIKHIDQVTVTKRQIIPIYQNEDRDEYLLDVFGHGFLNDRDIIKNIDNLEKYQELPFNELMKKNNIDIFTFNQLVNNFKNDRYTILQRYSYNINKKRWEGHEDYSIPYENKFHFSITNDLRFWDYEIAGQKFETIPNSFYGTEETTSVYRNVINIDRFEYTLVPSIRAGLGVCIDIVPQCLVYDYDFEIVTPSINQKKQAYLENKTLENLYNYLISLKEYYDSST